ncbi:DUF1566 domain-containing protein [Flavobacterium sp.]|jgi:hypothetical protein|uniref:Lcl domain-containing protein n=1 Tax=Flavobacterium sp. TaxID=239 RepID=UPI0037C0CB44
MKKLITLLALAITLIATAQAPQGFNYQATVRNSSGALITNQNVLFKFNIMLNSQTSLPVYSETHQAPTDDLGQVNLVIGTGTPTTGSFSSINWGSGSYFLGIELNTGSGYVAMGTTQLLSVPYALHANTATSTTGNTGGFTHYIGELFGGGIVVSVWKTAGVEHGLIASLTNLSSGIQWTTPDFVQTEIGSAAQSPINGLANTNAIVAQAGAGTTYAAGLCKAYNAGGFTDWYLPATWELNQCYNAAMIVNELLGNTNGFQFSNSSISNYWSSTEYDGFNAWYHGFLYGSSENYHFGSGKLTNEAVRAVRRF